MSIVLFNTSGFFVSQLDYLRKFYVSNTASNQNTLKHLTEMFDVHSPFLMDAQFARMKSQAQDPNFVISNPRKRRRNQSQKDDEMDLEGLEIKALFTRFLQDMKALPLEMSLEPDFDSLSLLSSKFPVSSNASLVSLKSSPLSFQDPNQLLPFHSISRAADNNLAARRMCSHLYELIQAFFDTEGDEEKQFEGKNETDEVVVQEIGNPSTNRVANFVLPPRCSFYNLDIRHLDLKMNRLGRFDLVLLDPPWSNKFIRRKKRQKVNTSSSWYSTMDNGIELSRIPMASLLKPSALVAVWCTNNKSHISLLVNSIFPAWGLEYVATWYWVKVTKFFDPVLQFSSSTNSKQPYERLVFGGPTQNCQTSGQTNPNTDNSENPISKDGIVKRKHPAEKMIIVSVPSAVHSHKPTLAEILTPYLPADPDCLELFARALTPGWTALGNQVLAFQFEELFR